MSALLTLAFAASLPAHVQDENDLASPRRLAVSDDGRFVAVAAKDDRVRVWNIETGKLLHALEIDRQGSSVALSAKGEVLVAGTIGDRPSASVPVQSNLFAWSLAGDKPKLLWKAPQVGAATAVAIDPRGKWCATVTAYGRLNVFDLKSGDFKRSCQESGNGLYDLSISPDGRTIATAGQQLRFWDVEAEPLPSGALPTDVNVTVEQSQRFLKSKSGIWGKAIVIAPSGAWAAALGSFESPTGHADALGRVELPSAKTMGKAARNLGDANSLSISSDGKLIALGFDAPKVEIRVVDSWSIVRTIELGDFGQVRSVCFFDGGKRIAIASQHGAKVEVRTIADGKRVRELHADR